MPFIESAGFIHRKKRQHHIEDRFTEYEWKGLLVMILAFIKERALDINGKCTLADIQFFLDKDILPYCKENFTREDAKNIARYCVVNVLQNGGRPYTYKVLDFEDDGNLKTGQVSLIEDSLINTGDKSETSYRLTELGYDFLFRTLEVGEYYEIDVHSIIMKEQLKKGQYGSLEKIARDWVFTIRRFLEIISDYEKQIRHDVASVDPVEFMQKINEFYDIAREREQHASENLKLIRIQNEGLASARLTPEEVLKAKKQLSGTEKYIITARSLLRKCLESEYEARALFRHELTRYSASSKVHFDMQENILMPIQKCSDLTKVDSLFNILSPLFMPVLNMHLTPGLFYQRQDLVRKADMDDAAYNISDEEYMDEAELEKDDPRLIITAEFVLQVILQAGRDNGSFYVSDLWKMLHKYTIPDDCEKYLTEGNLYFQIIAAMYRAGSDAHFLWKETEKNTNGMDIQAWLSKLNDIVIPSPGTVFDLSSYLNSIRIKNPSLIIDVEKITLSSIPGRKKFEITYMADELMETTIKMDDLLFEFTEKEKEKNDDH